MSIPPSDATDDMSPRNTAKVTTAGQVVQAGAIHGSVNIYRADESSATAIRTLPGDITAFTGRRSECERILRCTSGGTPSSDDVKIIAIDGMAGVGKTAFAVHIAHQLAPQFPDGQIFLRLYGHTPGHHRVDPAEALYTLLITMGVTPQQIPPGTDARAAVWRGRSAHKRLLLLLDDTTGSAQIKLLLPGGADNLVLLTSRRRLALLPEALPVTLDVLDADDAETLFVRLTGLRTQDDSIPDIMRSCGYLPLAISLMAGYLKHHHAWTPTHLLDELNSVKGGLEAMCAEDDSVAIAFDLSYRELTADQQQMFRRLGLHPGSDFDSYAAAALGDLDMAASRRTLDALFSCHLVEEVTRGRYSFHDLIREHARGLAQADDVTDRDAAVVRLMHYYLATALAADRYLTRHPRDRGHEETSAAPTPLPRLSSRDEAATWMAAERLNLQAVVDHATRHGRAGDAVVIAAAMHGFLRTYGHWHQDLVLQQAAVAVAHSTGDRAGEANALHCMGEVQRLMGEFRTSIASLRQALDLYRELDDRFGEANVLNDLGFVQRRIGEYLESAASLSHALELYRALKDKLGEARALNYLGDVQRLTGDYPAATASQQNARELFRILGDRIGEANVLTSQGEALRILGVYATAITVLDESLDLFRSLANRHGEANALNYLGDVQRLTGDYPTAAANQEKALALYRELGNRHGEASALNYLGEVQRATGSHVAAAASQEQSLQIHRELGNQHGEARTLISIGELALIDADTVGATERFHESLQIARTIAAQHEEAESLEGLGRCGGRATPSADLLRQALEIYRRISSPRAHQLEEMLRGSAPPLDPD